jgi:hypothetical protein
MAVKSLMKSSGMVALAAGIAALALPTGASAQSAWRHAGDRGGQSQAQSQAPAQSNAGNWQHRGNGEARGNGGNWQGRRDGGWRGGNWSPGRPQAQVQAPAQVQVAPQQVQRSWNGGDRSNWRQNNVQNDWQQRRAQQQAQQNVQRRWDGQNTYRSGDTTRRWDGNRTWSGRTGNYSAWNNNWRRDNRYNWYSYRNANRNVFRLGRYYSPYNNWSYRRLNIGFFLEPLFYSSNYWLDDPWQYRLPEAYGPYRWVRYYDDALLVDTYTGEVVDVIYDFFW